MRCCRLNLFGHFVMTIITGGLWLLILLIRPLMFTPYRYRGISLFGHVLLTIFTGGIWLLWLFVSSMFY